MKDKFFEVSALKSQPKRIKKSATNYNYNNISFLVVHHLRKQQIPSNNYSSNQKPSLKLKQKPSIKRQPTENTETVARYNIKFIPTHTVRKFKNYREIQRRKHFKNDLLRYTLQWRMPLRQVVTTTDVIITNVKTKPNETTTKPNNNNNNNKFCLYFFTV